MGRGALGRLRAPARVARADLSTRRTDDERGGSTHAGLAASLSIAGNGTEFASPASDDLCRAVGVAHYLLERCARQFEWVTERSGLDPMV